MELDDPDPDPDDEVEDVPDAESEEPDEDPELDAFFSGFGLAGSVAVDLPRLSVR